MRRFRGAAAVLIAFGMVSIAAPWQRAEAVVPDKATLIVHKGGDRLEPEVVGGPADAVFGFFAGTSDVVPPVDADPTYTCTTTAPSGTCSVDVDQRNTGNQGYWIREITAPPNFAIVNTLDVGFGSNTSAQPYNQLFTGHVSNNTEYNFPQASDEDTELFARGDRWADVRNNPDLPEKCGLNIALLIDTSGSITPFLQQVKDAANGFVDALTGTPSQIAVFRFAATASAVLPATPVSEQSGADSVKAAINGLTSGGTTNWDQGLFQIAAASFVYDAVLMLTDGNPTVYGPGPDGPGNATRFREVENGIFSANAVKAKGTKVVAVGVGEGVAGGAENLQSVSGPNEGDDYIQTDYEELAEVFRELALRTCSGSISVVKKVIPPDGGIPDATVAGGWTFNVTTNNTTPLTGVTDAMTGAVSFTAQLGGELSVPVTIVEELQTGYTLVQDGGLNATCTRNGQPAQSTNSGALGFTVDATLNAIVSCTVYNRAPQPPASVKVNKTWTINGTPYVDPAQPDGFEAQLTIDGQNREWGVTYDGFTANQEITIAETINEDLLPPGCTVAQGGQLGEFTLVEGLNTFEVSNVVTCVTTLKLLKMVQNPYGPPEPVTSWTLSAYPPDSQVPVITGVSGISGEITAGTEYSLGETTVPGYQQEIADGQIIVPPATGSWHCVLRLGGGMVGPEFGGPDGTVTVQLGQNAECTTTNTAQAAKLTLRKQVDNTHGGTAIPGDWTLTAAPPPNSGVTTITGRDGEPAVTAAEAIPGVGYTLSESNVPGYEPAKAVECVLSGTETVVVAPGGVLTPELGQDITCTFTNKDLPPTPSPTPPPLPETGSSVAPMAKVGFGAVGAGILLLLASLRRRYAR